MKTKTLNQYNPERYETTFDELPDGEFFIMPFCSNYFYRCTLFLKYKHEESGAKYLLSYEDGMPVWESYVSEICDTVLRIPPHEAMMVTGGL